MSINRDTVITSCIVGCLAWSLIELVSVKTELATLKAMQNEDWRVNAIVYEIVPTIARHGEKIDSVHLKVNEVKVLIEDLRSK